MPFTDSDPELRRVTVPPASPSPPRSESPIPPAVHPVQPTPSNTGTPTPGAAIQPVSRIGNPLTAVMAARALRDITLADEPPLARIISRSHPTGLLTSLAYRAAIDAIDPTLLVPPAVLKPTEPGGKPEKKKLTRAQLRDRREIYAYNYFTSKGLTPVQAAGLTGNLLYESGGYLSPYAKQQGGGPGRGIAQWEVGDSRYDGLLAFAKSKGKTASDFKTQVQYVWHELTTTETGSLKSIKAATTISAATTIVESQYERPDPSQAHLPDRIRDANLIFDRFNSG